MIHKAWCSTEEVPYYFSRSSIKFQGHGLKNRRIESNLSKIISYQIPQICLVYDMEVIMEVHWNISGFFCHSYSTNEFLEISKNCSETVSRAPFTNMV